MHANQSLQRGCLGSHWLGPLSFGAQTHRPPSFLKRPFAVIANEFGEAASDELHRAAIRAARCSSSEAASRNSLAITAASA